ncbi:GH12 family glycosyl hydrolase domain-containing protein [Streptomyces xanthophaeus]|uniref:GH12 family glycosyl hydrolase domain-containing protein n=1 Tax=Streptomyces xanthophaeus TaxID=67385 RepID=UPI0039900D81
MRNILNRPRYAVCTLAGLVAAALLGALSLLTAAAPASAATPICAKYGSEHVSGGKYIVQNNEWGDNVGQCIEAFDRGFTYTSGYHNKAGSPTPAGYPSIFAGCHWGNCSTGNGLPQQVSALTSPRAHADFTTAEGQWNASYDIWFDTNPNPSGQNNGAELMIWANHAGPPQPFGKKISDSVWVDGANWELWYGPQSATVNGVTITWNTVSYVRKQTVNSLTVNIKDFTNDMKTRGYIQSWWYMTSVQAGFEPWVGGPGLAVRNFSYTSNSGSTAGDTIVGQQSGRCVDAGGTGNGAPVQLWDCWNTANQKWKVNADGTITGQQSGKCLDAGGTANGSRLQLWDCWGTANQKWKVNADGTITGQQSGKCLDAGGTANGSRLQLWDCWGTANQKWSVK